MLLICYHNSFLASFHFDDIANIILNTPLHLEHLTLSSIKQTFFAYPEATGKLLRPVSNFTIALNWFFGRDNVLGYHLVNFSIHVCTTLFLFHTCILILNTPVFANRYRQNALPIAALAALLWAVNPLQTQAVVYIVQRMASLTTLFYLAAIWSYLKARLLPVSTGRRMIYYFCTCLAFLLAIGSKENAILFPFSLLLIEIIFFQKNIRCDKKTLLYAFSALSVIGIFTLLLASPGFFSHLLASYDNRNFSPWQRLLTESRIVLFYLSLIFYPSPLRLSITHDIQLSTSLFAPITTIFSVLTLLLFTVLPLIYRRKYPLLSFAILFFLLNHIVESSIIPLELLFEHRNYLPSLFLFLPPAAASYALLERCKDTSRPIYLTTVSGFIAIIILFMLGTIARNSVWQTERSLWADSLQKAPRTVRSYVNLAHVYLFQDKNYKKAFELNFLSLDKYSPTPWKDRLRAYNNLGYIMTRVGNYPEALTFYDKALAASKAHPGNSMDQHVLFGKIQAQQLSGKIDTAIQSATKLVQDNPGTGSYLQLLGDLLIRTGDNDRALTVLHMALVYSSSQSFEYQMALLDLSLIYGRLGSPLKANFFTTIAGRLGTPAIPTYLCILENNVRAHHDKKADQALRILLSQLTWPHLVGIIEKRIPDRPILPLTEKILEQYMSDWLTDQQKS